MTELKMSRKELTTLLIQEQFDLLGVIDAVIELNGIVGVGLTDLSEHIRRYIMVPNRGMRKLTHEEIDELVAEHYRPTVTS